MDRKLILKGRYHRTIPIDKAGYAEEVLELDADKTTFVGMHCWNIGCPDGSPIDMNYCVGMGYPQTFTEAYRIVKEYIKPAMDSARRAKILVSHVESSTIGAKHPEAKEELDPEPKEKPIAPAQVIPGYRQSILYRTHGKDYDKDSPYTKMDRINIVMPQPGEPFVSQTGQFDRILRKRGIENIIYSGFATDMCILYAPGGTVPMASLGYRVYIIREATLGLEGPDTFDERIATRWGLRMFERSFGNSISFEDFIKNCERLTNP